MSPEVQEVHRLVEGLGSRERRLILTSLGLRAVLLVAGLLVFAAACARWAPDPGRAAVVLGVGGLVGAWIGVVDPVRRAWRNAQDVRRQARLVEAIDPRLAGRLVIVAERTEGARPGESAEILDGVARSAAALARPIGVEQVHPATPVRRLAGLSLGGWLLVLIAVLAAPGGGPGVWRWWFGGASAAAAADVQAETEAAPPARVGDLTLRYVYPDYTGLEPYEVVNSTGEARAVPGTRVEVVARSGAAVDAASLVAYDEEPLSVEVTDGRLMRGSFVVGAEPGSYHFLTYDHGEARRSKDFAIQPEADLAPEVTLDAPAPLIEVALNEALELGWTARDDFGIQRVEVLVDGKAVDPALQRPDRRTPALDGKLSRRPSQLGMVAGGTYELAVGAWDNDTVSGSKMGRSGVIKVVVLDEDGRARVDREDREELLKLLVTLLADHLEEPFPPGTSSGDLARWGEVVNARYVPVVTFLEGFRSRRGRMVRDFSFTQVAVEAGRALIRFSQVSFQAESNDAVRADAMATLTGLRTEAIETAEDAVLDLYATLRQEALTAMLEAVRDLQRRSGETLAAARSAEEPLGSVGLLLDATMQQLAVVRKEGTKLAEGALRDLVAQRSDEIDGILGVARQALAAGDRERATRFAERAAAQVDELAQAIAEDLDRRRKSDEGRQQRADELVEALKALRDEEAALADRVGGVREVADASRAPRILDLWRRAEAAADAAAAEAKSVADALQAANRPPYEVARVAFVRDDLKRVAEAVVVRDLPGAGMGAVEARRAWADYAGRISMLGGRSGEPSNLGGVTRKTDELLDLLEQLRRLGESLDPAAMAQVRAETGTQVGLSNRLAAVTKDAERVAQEMSVRPRGLEAALKGAAERMTQSSQELGRGSALAAEGAERAAVRHLEDAIEALSKAGQQQRRQQSGGGGEGGDGSGGPGGEEGGGGQAGEEEDEGGGGRNDEQESEDPGRVELPEPEEFRTPEAYRQALIEGMKGEVPEEFRALMRRYYEELVAP